MLKVFGWLSLVPLGLLHGAGALVGWITYLASPTYRRRFDANVRQAGLARRAARGAIAGAGRMMFELPLLWRKDSIERLAGRVRCTGLEAIEAALARGRGAVILTPHMGCFEVAAQAYAMHFAPTHGPMTVLFRPARQPWLRELVATARAKPGVAPAPATLGGVRQMMRALKRGEVVGLLPDQVPPEGMGEWVPFFGRPAYTMTLAAKLAQQTGAALLVCWGERLPRGRGYAVHYEPFSEPLPADASAQAESAAAINRAMERLILRCPEQYLWGYNRYKTPRRSDLAAEDENKRNVD
jgi:KDO2-lipid IV(A) lauroyltransferase